MTKSPQTVTNQDTRCPGETVPIDGPLRGWLKFLAAPIAPCTATSSSIWSGLVSRRLLEDGNRMAASDATFTDYYFHADGTLSRNKPVTRMQLIRKCQEDARRFALELSDSEMMEDL